MSKVLPDVVEAAIPVMNLPRPGFNPFDPGYRAQLLQWGLEMIAKEIRPDPIFRPLDYARKLAAEHEWRRVVREGGVEQRRIVAEAAVVVAQQQIEQIVWQFQEARRRDATTFDSNQRVGEQQQMMSFSTDEEIRKAEALARINAQYQTASPPVEDAFTIAAQFERKIAEVGADPTLSQDEKHRRTLYWQTAMQAALAGRGNFGRG